MTATDAIFTGSIPEMYERYLVPLIFEAPAADLAAMVGAAQPGRVLETAAGTGVLTRALGARLPEAAITATDLNAAMLAVAAGIHPAQGRIAWQQADALALPFPDGTFDAVCCQFGLMFFPDRVAGLAEARRVLVPGGLLAFSVWDEIGENHFAALVTQAAAEVFPLDPPLFLARTPHGYHDTGRIAADVAAAGLTLVTLRTVRWESHAPSPRHPAVAYAQGTPLRAEIEARDPARLTEVTDRAEALIAARCGSGSVTAPIRGHLVLARSPGLSPP